MLIRVYRESLEFDRRVLLEEFHLQDFARKVVGVGSVGTRAWIGLMMGRDGDDPLFLQIKEAEASVLEPFLGASEFANHGQRVVTGQRLMQAASDIFLGWVHDPEGLDGRAPRLLRPPAEGLEGLGRDRADDSRGHDAPTAGCAAGRSPARTPAAATGSRSPPTWAGGDTFDRAILEFSKAYADAERARLQRAGRRGQGRPGRRADRTLSRPSACGWRRRRVVSDRVLRRTAGWRPGVVRATRCRRGAGCLPRSSSMGTSEHEDRDDEHDCAGADQHPRPGRDASARSSAVRRRRRVDIHRGRVALNRRRLARCGGRLGLGHRLCPCGRGDGPGRLGDRLGRRRVRRERELFLGLVRAACSDQRQHDNYPQRGGGSAAYRGQLAPSRTREAPNEGTPTQ